MANEELYIALRKADAAGDVEGARRLAAYIKTQPSDGEVKKSPMDMLEEIQPSAKSSYKEPSFGEKAKGVLEAGASLATGIPAGVAGGAVGLAARVGGASMQDAESRASQVSNNLTYQPRSATGQEYAQKAGDVLSSIPPILPGTTKMPQLGVAGEMAGKDAFAKAPEGIKSAASNAIKATESNKTVYARAENAVNTKTNVDWATLPKAVRQRITDLAKDATTFDKMTPDMLVRASRLNALPEPITATKGQLSRDPVQLRTETQLSQTEAGSPIRERYQEQNKALLNNLDILKGRTGAKAVSEEGVGQSIDVALGTKANKAIANYERLYKSADDAGETNGKVSTYPLLDHLAEHPDPTQIPYLMNKLNGMKLISKDDFGNPMPTGDISLKQLESVRRAASAAMKAGGEKAHYAGELASVIDQMTEGKGGEKYQAARKAFKNFKLEFDEQKAVKNIVGMKNRMDRQTSLENVFSKTVISGDLQALRQVKRSLLVGGDKETTELGVQAFKELRGQTIQYIKDEATKGVAPDELGNQHVLASGMKRAIDRIGNDKLNEIFGKNSANQINNLLEATKDLKTAPPSRIAGSDTHVNLLNSLDKIVSHIPLIGPVARGAAKFGKKAYDAGLEEKRVGEALNPSLKDYLKKPAE